MFKQSDLSSSGSFASAFMKNAYPGDEIRVKNTTRSTTSGYNSGFSLTSRTLSEALSGDVINRNGKLALKSWSGFLDSDIKSMVIGGAEIGYSTAVADDEGNPALSVVDPNSSNTKNVQKLTGGLAFNELLKNSILSRNLGSSIIGDSINTINNIMINGQKNGVLIDGIAHDPGMSTYTNIELVGASARSNTGGVAIESMMTQHEIDSLKERARILRGYNIVSDSNVLVDGFLFDLPNELSNLTQNKGYPQSGSMSENVLDTVIQLGSGERAYIAPVIIELLIYLGSSDSDISVICNTGANGTVTGQEFGESVNALQSGDIVSDHIFGRAIDIISVSRSDGTDRTDIYNNGNGVSANLYRIAFELLMDELNKIGLSHPYLLPDTITVHPDLSSEYEIQDGQFEVANSSIKNRYPGLKYVDFYATQNSRSHIHLSFGAARCGMYTDPGVLQISGTYGSGVEVDLSGGLNQAVITVDNVEVGPVSALSNPALTASYSSNKSGTITSLQLFDGLRNIMVDEAAAVFAAITARESNARPAAFNPRTWIEGELPNFEENNGSSTGGRSYQVVTTGEAFYNKAYEAYLAQANRPSMYDGSKSSRIMSYVHNPDPTDPEVYFDCSALVYWAAYHVGIHIKKVGSSGFEIYTNSTLPADAYTQGVWDWSYSVTQNNIMEYFGTNFVKSDGTPDLDFALNTKGAILYRRPRPEDDNRPGHVAISAGDGNNIVHAATTAEGIKFGSARYTNAIWDGVGMLPGIANPYNSTSAPVNLGASKGDFSFGLFQINLVAHGNKDFFLPLPLPGASEKGWRLGMHNWQALSVDSFEEFRLRTAQLWAPYKNASREEKNRGIEEISRYLDERLWVPLNQIYMLYTTIKSTLPTLQMREDQKLGYNNDYIFFPWGDYDGGPYYGFISNTKFSDAVNIYVQRTGKTVTELRQWVLDMFSGPGSGSKSAPYAQDWVNGWIYKSQYVNGSFLDSGRELDSSLSRR